jgi:predicted  nucleic acid-binding Zn-ribbon protein
MARVRALESETGDLRAALDLERKQHEETRKSLQGAVRERDEALSSLKGTQEVVKSDLTSHRDNLTRVQQELAAATIERTALDGRLAETLSQVRSLEEKLNVASGEQADADRQVRALSDELGRVKADLEAERRQRRSGEDEVRSALQAGEKANAAVQQAATERDRLQKLLDAEREERRAAEERVRSLEDSGESQIRNLSHELADAKDRIGTLTGQVQAFREENERVTARVTELEDEIEQARTALADEWEDHVTDNERFAAATISPQPEPAPEPSPLRVTSVEDLFEDEPEDNAGEDELPAVSIIRETDPVVAPGIMAVDDIPAGEDEVPAIDGEPDAEELSGDEEESELAGGNEGANEDDSEVLSGSGPSFVPMPMGAGVPLDRSQWLDLLKWAHHSGALSQDQRLQIVKMGRLIQKGRRLTRRQETQVHDMISLARSLGYRPS